MLIYISSSFIRRFKKKKQKTKNRYAVKFCTSLDWRPTTNHSLRSLNQNILERKSKIITSTFKQKPLPKMSNNVRNDYAVCEK